MQICDIATNLDFRFALTGVDVRCVNTPLRSMPPFRRSKLAHSVTWSLESSRRKAEKKNNQIIAVVIIYRIL